MAGVGALALLLLLVAIVLWPLLRLVTAGLAGALGASAWRLFLNSVAVAVVSTVLTIAVALGLALAATRTTEAVARLVAFTARLPLLAPPFLVPLSLLLFFGAEGIVTRGFGLEGSIGGFAGIVAAQVLTFLSPATRVATDAVARIDAALEEAAWTLGAGSLTRLSRVTLAEARAGLGAAGLGVFVLALSDFVTPFILGGGFEVLTTAIYARAVTGGHLESAAVLGLMLLVPCLGASALGGSRTIDWRGGQRPVGTVTSAAARRVGVAVGATLAVVVGVLYAAVIVRGLVVRRADGWSLIQPGDLVSALAPVAGSLTLAMAAGIAGTVLVLALAYIIDRRTLGPVGTSAMTAMSLLPAALPGAVLGLGYLLAFPRPFTGTLWVLAASVVAWAMPAAVLVARSGVARIEPAMEEAARSLGAGVAGTFGRIVLPLLKGPALAVFAWFFVQGLVTVSMVVFLVEPGLPLASVAALAAAREGDLGGASVLTTVLLALAAGAVLVLGRLAGRQRAGLLAL